MVTSPHVARDAAARPWTQRNKRNHPVKIVRANPFVTFHRAAEAAGYPALLIVTLACLALVVAPIALLALSPTAGAFAFAILSLVVALAILSTAIFAMFTDTDRRSNRQPPRRRRSRDS
jgi:hypothetical protein